MYKEFLVQFHGDNFLTISHNFYFIICKQLIPYPKLSHKKFQHHLFFPSRNKQNLICTVLPATIISFRILLFRCYTHESVWLCYYPLICPLSLSSFLASIHSGWRFPAYVSDYFNEMRLITKPIVDLPCSRIVFFFFCCAASLLLYAIYFTTLP